MVYPFSSCPFQFNSLSVGKMPRIPRVGIHLIFPFQANVYLYFSYFFSNGISFSSEKLVNIERLNKERGGLNSVKQ